MAEPSDEALMDAFCLGDEAAFDELFRRHSRPIHAFLGRMVRDPALAEDLLQTTFLSIVRSRGRYQRGAPVAPWFFSIAANAARDALRHRRVSVEDLARRDDLPSPEGSVDPELPDPGLARAISDAFAALPPQQREAVLLHRVQGWSFEAIAEALGTTSAAARVRAHRGYEKLKALLGGHLEEEP